MVDRRLKSLCKRISRMMRTKDSKLHPLADLAMLIPELSKISEILDDRLYLSGCMPVNKQQLSSLGITAVVSAMTEEEERENLLDSSSDSKFRRLCVRIADAESSDLSIYFRTVTSFVDKELRNGGRVLIHCVAGVSRSVTLTLAYLIRHHGYSALDAFLMVRSKRTIARPNDSFCVQLIKYQKSMGAENSVFWDEDDISTVAPFILM